MTNYYLSMGYGNTYSTGTLDNVPTLPMTEDDLISDGEFYISDDPFDYDTVRDEALEKLQDGDTLTIIYPNQVALYILDEWAEDFHIPQNQREELWNSEGNVETYIHFIDAEEENWYWLADAQVDYYDDNERPVPIYPADEEA
jgi:hypothetical protein